MFDAVTQMATDADPPRAFDRVEHIAVGQVADGMDVHGQTGTRRLLHLPVQMVRRCDRNAEVLRFALIGVDQQSRTRPQRTVGKDLDRTQADPLVAKAGMETKRDG